MLKIKHRGSFKHTERFMNAVKGVGYLNALDDYAKLGVEALAANTPKKTGKTASSWTYEIERTDTWTRVSWLNTNVNDNVNIAIILQYGHGTGTGGYVQGIDYINPAMKPIFDHIATGIWKTIQEA